MSALHYSLIKVLVGHLRASFHVSIGACKVSGYILDLLVSIIFKFISDIVDWGAKNTCLHLSISTS